MFEESEGNLPLPRGWPLWGTVCAVKPQYISGLLGLPPSGSHSCPEHRIVPFFLLFIFSLSLLPLPSSHLCQFATHCFIPSMLAIHTLLCTVSFPVCWPVTPCYALFHSNKMNWPVTPCYALFHSLSCRPPLISIQTK